MKKFVTLMVVVLMVAFAGVAFAGTADITVQATVDPGCSISAATDLVDFGAIDPGAVVPYTAAAPTITYQCNALVAITVGDGGAAYQMNDGGGNLITYTPTALDAGGVYGPLGTNVLVYAAGNFSIAVVDFQNKPAGAYSEVITVTVAP